MINMGNGEVKMSKKKKELFYLIIGCSGVFLGLYGVILFNRYVLMSLPLVLRMAAMIVTYWLTALVPVIIIFAGKEKFADYFNTDKIGRQIITGILIGTAMSVILTLIPHLAGFGAYVDNGKRYAYLWQFAYEFCYCILAVALSEELVFRGFIYNKIKNICGNEIAAVIGSSVIFGVFHIFGGNVVQIIVTALIGAFFCVCRIKIKGCTAFVLDNCPRSV